MNGGQMVCQVAKKKKKKPISYIILSCPTFVGIRYGGGISAD